MTAIAIAFVALYLLPSIVAALRRHHNTASVVVIDLLLGWTLVGWVVAMAMAVSAKPANKI